MANSVDQNSDENSDLDKTKKTFSEICRELDVDFSREEEAWTTYTEINRNVTLEGESLHWLACALYVACRKASVIREQLAIDSNGIPLAKLLASVNLSLLHFFQKVRKWLDMGKHGSILNEKINKLERNFSVSSIVFEKYSAIFKEMYNEHWTEQIKRGRRRQATSTKDIFNFCWTLYIRTKAQYPDISDDLVNSYHLLLCCLDLTFSNTLCVKEFKMAINAEFTGAPEDFLNQDFSTIEAKSIIDILCQLHEGLAIETKIIKRQYLGAFVEDLIKNNNLKGNLDKKSGLLDATNFDSNFKYLNDSYEKQILQMGDIDERIFIKEDATKYIGTPTKKVTAFTDVDEKESSAHSSITLSVSRLQELVKGLKPSASEHLIKMFESFKENPEEKLRVILNSLSSTFLEEYSKPLDENNQEHSSLSDANREIAKTRLHLALVLFYKTLENFLEAEKKKSPAADLSVLLEQEIFVKCLFTCCLEIVIYSYTSSRVFPWILKAFNLKPYYFFKVIELVIRGEDLSRDVIKHLSKIEEEILEYLSWKTGSPVYASIQTHGIPRCQHVASDSGVMTPLFFMSPTTIRMNKDGLQQSPMISLREKFGAPPGSPARRNLFGSTVKTESHTPTTATINKPATAVVLPPKTTGTQSPLSSVRFPIMLTSPGSSPVRLFAVTPQRGTPPRAGVIRIQASPNKANAKKFGSLGIFFRKLYYMASVRLKDLCDKLGIGNELHKKIWTCFEHSLVENIDMLRDRHVDQLIMCAVYVMSKITKEDKSFHEIMKWYRTQPQANSDVYRRVLIERPSDREKSVKSNSSTAEDIQQDSSSASTEATIKQEEDGTCEQQDSKPDVMELNIENSDKNVYNDLIQFYNIVYIKKIKEFALKFATNKVTLDAPPLSPLPVTRKQVHSPRKVSKQHQIYISPIKPAAQMTPRSKMLYCFDSDSPKKLNEINAMIKGGTRRRVILDADDESGPTPPKRPVNGLAKRAQELRQEQMNHRSLNNHK